ncbi:MAG: TraR/DksA family transcriptional regulator [Simkaniaceae bacterium]|nr:TraR/DksA family transcriptional regulator [Candidatus Sacchlamyda saccharinae]
MPLKKSQIEHFKQRLLELRAEMTKMVKETADDVRSEPEAKGYSQHQADEGTDDFDKTISLQLTNKELDIVRQIDRALEKIEEGTYGICDVSKEEISIKRLEAIPYANMTVVAQERLEKGEIA